MSQIKIIITALLIVAYTINLAIASGELLNKIFSSDAERISSEETLELLIELEKSDVVIDKSLVSALVEAGRISEDKCTDDGILNYSDTIKKGFAYQVQKGTSSNGLRYMLEKRREIFKLCYPFFSAQLWEKVKAVDANELNSISALVNLMDMAYGDEQRISTPRCGYFSPEIVGYSVLSFIQSEDGLLDLYKDSEEDREELKGILKEKVERLVQGPSKRIADALGGAAQNFDPIVHVPELAKKVKLSEWMIYNIVTIANRLSARNTFEYVLKAANLI